MPNAGESKAYLEAIRKVTGELTSTLDVGEVLRDVVRLTAEATNARGSALRLLDERTHRLELSASWGLSAGYLAKGPIDGGQSLSACMGGEIVHIRDVRTDPRVQYPREAEAEGIASMLSVPMALRGKVIGVVRLYSAESRAYSEEEMEFLRALADLGALAIEHARLYSSLKADHESLIGEFHAWFESSVYPPEGAPKT
ncbi:MAG: GAF domain-containing protein [Candidatus Tectomicrobia bacterium]|nr:GAF domain-containing protein [Candidatus Tectomicrobia bacterium]MBI2178398.1 GAF domain-containing protein [Candidatus Tectomicrobia bacterium]MBI3025379.1 GAF domain-containing protein [Candidatus Tectomicrobia bacterium]